MSDDPAPVEIRDAVLRQWRVLATRSEQVDPDVPSRVVGWRNREVLAHLAVQPKLLRRFLERASTAAPRVSLVENLCGTRTLAEIIDSAAREAAGDPPDLGAEVERAAPVLESADLGVTVPALQGPMSLVDYLRTRCVEAVVHGCDLRPPVIPDPVALRVAATALLAVLAAHRPDLVVPARRLDPLAWVDLATGRSEAVDPFLGVVPLMA